jgi:hypothetical protein|tara:strand:+ start:724 stop:942 length:219 start_codon:yes stop_codon:yes gene_type:complete
MKTLQIKVVGECTYNYDFDVYHNVEDDVDVDSLDLKQIGQDYFYENFPNEVDTNGFDVTEARVSDELEYADE